MGFKIADGTCEILCSLLATLAITMEKNPAKDLGFNGTHTRAFA